MASPPGSKGPRRRFRKSFPTTGGVFDARVSAEYVEVIDNSTGASASTSTAYVEVISYVPFDQSLGRVTPSIFRPRDVIKVRGRRAFPDSPLGPINAALAVTEADDALSAAVGDIDGLSLTVTEAGDTLAGTETTIVSLSASITEADDTLAATENTIAGLILAVTEANDTLAGAAAVLVGLSLAADAADTLTAASVVTVGTSLTATEAGDTLAADIHVPAGVIAVAKVDQGGGGRRKKHPRLLNALLIEAGDTLDARAGVKDARAKASEPASALAQEFALNDKTIGKIASRKNDDEEAIMLLLMAA
jgi:hypothetical protein